MIVQNPMNYYLGGLAELVPHPTDLTFSFFQNWFTGAKSLGKAMQILNLPFVKTEEPILKLHDSQMVVDLWVEEKTLYSNTIFSYEIQKSMTVEPKLKINWSKTINPTKYEATISLFVSQTGWLLDPEKIVEKARRLIESIPKGEKFQSITEADEFLANFVWPVVLAVGALAEYFHRVVESEVKVDSDLWSEIDRKISIGDWFFNSLFDQEKLRSGGISWEKYLEFYGLRADLDYELSLPRWQEISKELKKRIDQQSFPIPNNQTFTSQTKFSPRIVALIELQKMRSQARRAALEPFNCLRQLIIDKVGSDQISELTREELIFGQNRKITTRSASGEKAVAVNKPTLGKGTAVSSGIIKGPVHHFNSPLDNVKTGVIGIFPNASPEFTVQFPQCAGLIFLRGGMTSHGAIVAREFKIPAIVDENAQFISEGAQLLLDGAGGKWEVLKTI